MLYKEIQGCRVCGNDDLVPVLDLGVQCLSGVFPRTATEHVPSAPLQLLKCGRDEDQGCGLIQLRHTCRLSTMYGDRYGYRSGLNASMVRHLWGLVDAARQRVDLRPGDVIVDIGSNDGTLLNCYPDKAGLTLIGIDPIGQKWKSFYRADAQLITDFFSKSLVQSVAGGRRARVITSIAMLYDLEAPLQFMRDVSELLADDGIWIFEQSYLPRMIETTAYDTICHEHLEYYAIRQIQWLLNQVGLHIVDIQMNDINGGSFLVTAARQSGPHRPCDALTARYLRQEGVQATSSLHVYREFAARIDQRRTDLWRILNDLASLGISVFGYGASTKGNVLLQYCHLDRSCLPYIADVNPDKYDCYTPGTRIPIISEVEAREMCPGCYLVLPWHFRKFIVAREQEFLKAGGAFLFPLPHPEIFSLADFAMQSPATATMAARH
jgi:NDP-4-keto-2,6-dideoxyhexose 3-C-methyltransferase